VTPITRRRAIIARWPGLPRKGSEIGKAARKLPAPAKSAWLLGDGVPSTAPGKSGGGQRLYTPREVRIILRIKELFHREGFMIAGAKKMETEMAEAAMPPIAPAAAPPAAPARRAPDLSHVKKELRAILEMLSS
jgi:hypothetical protein